MKPNALYYPYIEFRSIEQIKAELLIYDSVYRIVPDGIDAKNDIRLDAFMETGALDTIRPELYVKRASDKFLKSLEHWSAAGLDPDDDYDQDLAFIHQEKVDYRIKNLFEELGYKSDSEWINVPTRLASNYMVYLAREISARNNFDMVTTDWAPWTATTFFNQDGELGFPQMYDLQSGYYESNHSLFSLIISDMIPINIYDIPCEKIIEFRQKRRDEIQNFRIKLSELAESLSVIEERKVSEQIVKQAISDFRKAVEDYKSAALEIKVTGWCGYAFNTLFSLTSFLQSFGLLNTITIPLISGIASVGGICDVSSVKSKLKKLKKESPASFFHSLNSDFSSYRSNRGDGINMHAYNCLEEYIND